MPGEQYIYIYIYTYICVCVCVCVCVLVQEHRYTPTEDIKYHDTGNGWTLATASAWKNSVYGRIGCVGMLIGRRTIKALNSIEKIQPRMMVATFNGNPSATFIACDNPTHC